MLKQDNKFSAFVSFCYASYDAYDCENKKYPINITVRGDFKSPKTMIIESPVKLGSN